MADPGATGYAAVGNERPGSVNFPGRPVTSSQIAPPFPFAGRMSGPEGYPPSFRMATPPVAHLVPDAGAPPRFPPPNLHSTPSVQPPPFSLGQPVLRPPVVPSVTTSQAVPSSASFPRESKPISVPFGFPSQRGPPVSPRASAPPPISPFPGPIPSSQPNVHGYPPWQSKPAPPVSPAISPLVNAPQVGHIASPSFVSPLTQPPQYPSSGPPLTAVQGLAEEFSSLSIASVPGTTETGLDPKSLPRPLDDKDLAFPSQVYPLNCHPQYMRMTTNAIPNSQSLLSRWHLPLGVVVHPLAETPEGEEVPVVNFGPTGIIRCRRCRTYVNPYVTFTDGGRKWRCNLCALLNDVPGDYFSLLDASGRRCDADQRPELTKGTVDFIASTEYMVRPPMPPLYFFLIDVSLFAARNGMLEIIANTIKSCLDELPGFPRTQIGFITYDSTIHFYNMKSSLTQPQMMVVSNLDDIFAPLPDDLLVNLSESRSVVDSFLDSLPCMFQDNVNIESAFGPALKATLLVMSQLGGKLLIFQSSLPSLGVGRLRLRGDDPRVYGTDKEQALRAPEDPFYKQMAAELTKHQIGVNVYAFSEKYTDIASLGTLAKYTGGQVYYYSSFQGDIHGEKLRHDLARDLTRETAWEAVMRIRCSKGVRFTTFHGHFMLRSVDLLALPAVDCDKAFAMQLALEETLLTSQIIYLQAALLYTSSAGERRIRVHTAAVPIVSDLGEMYRNADIGAVVSLLTRIGIEKSLSSKLEDARQAVQLKIIKCLREYRNLYAVQHRLSGRFIYPESLKLLPLFGLAICKSLPLRGGYADVQLDERCAAGYSLMILPVKRLLKVLYPSLLQIDEFLVKGSFKNEGIPLLKKLPLSTGSLEQRGIYILDDNFRFVLWFGRSVSPAIIGSLLGVDTHDLSKILLCESNDPMSRKFFSLLMKLRAGDPSSYQLCELVRQGEQPREALLLLTSLIEDQIGGTVGYIDWIQQIHRQVQQIA